MAFELDNVQREQSKMLYFHDDKNAGNTKNYSNENVDTRSGNIHWRKYLQFQFSLMNNQRKVELTSSHK